MEEGTIAVFQNVPKFHQGMHEFPFSIISENLVGSLGNMSSHDQGSKHITDLEQQDYTAMYILGLIEGGVNNHSNAPFLSGMQHVGLGCKILEDMVNIVPLYDDVLPSTQLDPYGFKMIIDGRYFLGDLQGVAVNIP